jgi:glycine/D-amino acid oxidase-like deaminating enzyme
MKLSRRDLLLGAAGAGVGWAGATLPGRWLGRDPARPPELYEYFVDCYWFDSAGLRDAPLRPPLEGDQHADVAILGGGFTGLATAYHLARRDPERRIVVLEGARCGYGASGRNGGFADVTYAGFPAYLETQGPERARVVHDAIALGMETIERFVREHGVDCDLEHNGSLRLMSETQLEDAQDLIAAARGIGLEMRAVQGAELRALVRTERFAAGITAPDTSILNPAKLARGMLRVVESLGVEIFEATRVLRVEPGNLLRIRTEFGGLAAPRVVLALNGYAPQIDVLRSRLVPLCNYVVATEPLSASQWEAIGWSGRQGLSDGRVQFMYLRPTADGRIVAGGEMAPLFYGSRPSSGNYAPAIEKLERSLVETFPPLKGIRFTHAWGGTMGFTRDFTPRIGALDDEGRLLFGLGYSGEGVVMSQLFGRMLARLVDGERGELEGLPFLGEPPWVGPEPLRSLGVRLAERALRVLAGEP